MRKLGPIRTVAIVLTTAAVAIYGSGCSGDSSHAANSGETTTPDQTTSTTIDPKTEYGVRFSCNDGLKGTVTLANGLEFQSFPANAVLALDEHYPASGEFGPRQDTVVYSSAFGAKIVDGQLVSNNGARAYPYQVDISTTVLPSGESWARYDLHANGIGTLAYANSKKRWIETRPNGDVDGNGVIERDDFYDDGTIIDSFHRVDGVFGNHIDMKATSGPVKTSKPAAVDKSLVPSGEFPDTKELICTSSKFVVGQSI